jgi:hypothetical protein
VAVIPDVRKQLLARKMGTTDFSTSMDSIPMGREMIKLMKRFGVAPRGQPNIKPIDPPPAL